MTALRDWKRLVLQGLGVTASILLAFGIDAAWDHRLDRREERQALIRLQEEFEVSRSRFATTKAMHQSILNSALALVAHIDTLREDPGHVVPDTLLPTLWTWQTYDPLQGTLNSLVSSGRLGLIENDRLRSALASWPDLVADLNEDEDSQRDVVRNHVIPYLARTGSLRRLIDTRAPELGFQPLSDDRSGRRDALLDPELEGWLIDRIEGKAALLAPAGELTEVEKHLHEILRLLDVELHGR